MVPSSPSPPHTHNGYLVLMFFGGICLNLQTHLYVCTKTGFLLDHEFVVTKTFSIISSINTGAKQPSWNDCCSVCESNEKCMSEWMEWVDGIVNEYMIG